MKSLKQNKQANTRGTTREGWGGEVREGMQRVRGGHSV